MAEQPNLKASIEIAGTFKVGANPQPANQFTLKITNLGGPVQRTDKIPHLYLKGRLGSEEEALFLDEGDARDCVQTIPADWKADWNFSGNGIFSLVMYTFNSTLFNKGDVLEIDLAAVVSKTAPGDADLEFDTDFSSLQQDISISKVADKPDIISFHSDPPEGVQNLPGENVTLKWRTYKLNNLELTQVGIADPLVCDFGQPEGARTITSVSADMEFRLRGYDGPRPVDRTLSVRVLRNDWYDMRNVILEGDPGYPSRERDGEDETPRKGFVLEPTLLLNAGDQRLYGLFRHEFQGNKRALLFQTENPFGGWDFVQSSVPDQEGFIPDGFSGSPGIYFNDKIWLMGGSQIDPGNTSNGIWCLDMKGEGFWKKLPDAVWSKRMGHTVLEFNNAIWVMGGRDEGGNALNDVWTFDAASGQWTSQGQAAWPPRCLFSPAVYEKQIWLYGGATEPFSAELYDDLYAYSSGRWDKKEMTGIIRGNESRKPIASCLQVFQDRLCLFGKFRTVSAVDKSAIVESLAFSLSDPLAKTWSRFSSDRLQNWWGDKTFSYQLVNFRDKMLIAKALGYKEPNPVLKVYIPGS
jgi:hypothetical protein